MLYLIGFIMINRQLGSSIQGKVKMMIGCFLATNIGQILSLTTFRVVCTESEVSCGSAYSQGVVEFTIINFFNCVQMIIIMTFFIRFREIDIMIKN